jgi:hypothetical protein
LNLQSTPRPGPQPTSNSKTKFTCPACQQSAWGKPDLRIVCKPCRLDMRPATSAAVVASYVQEQRVA